ncbi:MAG TPA: DUF6529 family protein [Allosphingosinicella sp.]|jgi:hypothetical protein
MEDGIEWIAGGRVLEVKILLASIVAALAFYQVALMAVGYGKVPLPFLKPVAAGRAHRAIGDAILVVTLFIAVLCLSYFEIDDDTALHAFFGSALLLALAAKVAVVRRWLPGDRYLPWLGVTVLVLFAGAWATSAARHLL